MSTIADRWRPRLLARQALLAQARARFRAHQTYKTHADVLKRLEQVREAQGVLKRHPGAPTGISDAGLELIKKFEGFVDHQYRDGRGVLTIGYGTTSADVAVLPKKMTEPQASALLEDRVDHKYAPAVLKALAPLDPTQNMVDACCSFAYNLGPGAFMGVPGFETLTAALHAGSRQRVADALLLYDNPRDPAVHAGLHARRVAERALFLKGASA